MASTAAAVSEYTDDPAALHSLLEQGLLAQVVPGSPESVAFASRRRLLPLALGLGNSAERPGQFAAGLRGRPLVVMSGGMYDLWQWAHLSPNLWLACQELALVARRAGLTDPGRTDPAQVLSGAFRSLHPLLATRVACLDTLIGTPP